MATRRETVVLELEDRYSAGMLRAAAATKVADDAMGRFNGTNGRTSRNQDRTSESTNRQSRAFGDLDQSARRAERSSSLLVDSLVGLGPALVPIGALAVPAVAGLTAQLGFAAAAAGTMLLAFHGIGDGLKAVDAYQLDPTTANLEKLNTTMKALGPSGRSFVLELDKIEPKLKSLKTTAEAGIFPGATAGIDSLLTILPQVRRIIGTISGTTGDLLGDAGKNLAGPQFKDFFDYLERDARPILTDLGKTLGNFTAGFANLFVALEPAELSFSGFLLNTSRDFNNWADGLENSKGLQSFLDYIHDTGPDVAQALGSIAGAVGAVGKAAAPLGGPILNALSGIADVIAKIAGSDLGTPLIALASGLAIVNRTIATGALLKGSSLGALLFAPTGTGPVGGVRGRVAGIGTTYSSQISALRTLQPLYRANAAAVQSQAAAERTAAAAHTRYVAALRGDSEQRRAGQLLAYNPAARPSREALASTSALIRANSRLTTSSQAAREAEQAKAQAFRASAAGVGKTAALVGALAVVTSGAGDKIGITNTATLGLAGSMAGPLGAAIGVGVGGLLDIRASAKDTTEAFDNLNKAANGDSFSQFASSLGDAQKKFSDYNNGGIIQGTAKTLGGFLHGDNLANNGDELRKQQVAFQNTKVGYLELASALNTPLKSTSLKDISKFADQVSPALKDAGISLKELSAGNPKTIAAAADAVAKYQASLDPTAPRSYADAVSQVTNGLTQTAQSASQLASALDALFSPQLNRAAAADAFTRSLQALRSQLSKGGGLTGDSAGALDNRAAIQGSTQALLAKIKAEADAGASSKRLAGILRDGRKAILDQGQAAGVARPELEKYLNTLGVKPGVVKAVLKAQDDATPFIQKVLGGLDKVAKKHPKPKISLKDDATPFIGGILGTLTSIDKKRAKPRVTLRDNATPFIASILGGLNTMDRKRPKPKATLLDGVTPSGNRIVGLLGTIGGKKPRPTVTVNDNASGRLSSIAALLGSLHSKTLTVTTRQVVKGSSAGGAAGVAKANGGWISGPGGPRDDMVPALLSNGEFVVNAKSSAKYARELEYMNRQQFANGGRVGGSVSIAAGSLPDVKVYIDTDLNGHIRATARFEAQAAVSNYADESGRDTRGGRS